MADGDLLQRLEELESRVDAIEGSRGPARVPSVEPEQRLQSMVLRTTPRALAVVLKGISLRDRARAFYLAPREVLQHLRGSVSARAWDDLVMAWKEGEGFGPRGIYVEEVLESFEALFDVGYLKASEPDGPIDEQVPESSLPRTSEYWAGRREEGRQNVERVKTEAENWLLKEVPELLK